MTFPFSLFDRILRPSGKRQIEAGGGGRRWQGVPMLASPSQSALAARGPSKARAASAYANTPHGHRIVESWVSALVGKGWQARSQHPEEEARSALNAAFEELSQPMMMGVARALVRDGEAFVQIVVRLDGTIALRQLAADQIDPALSRDLGGGRRIVAGIEFDETDEVVAYHVMREAPGSPFASLLDTVRIPAADILHIFDQLYPGQVRGLTWLAPVLLKLADRDAASDAMLMSLKVASLMTAFITDPEGGSAGFETTAGGLDVSLEPGVARILPPGAEVKFSQPPAGLAQAADFLKTIDREIAAGVGLTFEALTGDLGEANYSSARVGLLEFRRRAEALQRTLIEGQFLRPLWRRWIARQELSGRVPADLLRPEYKAVRFTPPGWQWVDPQSEVTADVAAIAAGLKSREEVVAGRGRDIDELDAERARDGAKPGGGAAP